MTTPVQLKTAEQIRDDILTEISAQTGINDQNLGSVTRTVAYSVGNELDELYFQLWRLRRAFYIKTATGTALDDRGADFGLTRRPAKKAVGTARFSGTNGTNIPASSRVSAPATTSRDKIQFSTPSSGTYTVSGGIVDVPIESLVAGAEGNLALATITQLDTSIAGISAVTNPAATVLGENEEDDDAFRARILRTIEGLSKGTIPSILNGAIDFEQQTLTLKVALPSGQNYIEVAEDLTTIPLSITGTGKLGINGNAEVISYTGINTTVSPHRITGVTRAQEGTSDINHEVGEIAIEYIPTGKGTRVKSASIRESVAHVDVYVDDGTTTGAHAELVSLVQKRLRGDGTERDSGYKGGGITLNAYAATSILIAITAVLQYEAGYDALEVRATVDADLDVFLNSFQVDQDVYGYQIACRIMDTPGVRSITSLSINGNTFVGTASADVSISYNQVARPGSHTIT